MQAASSGGREGHTIQGVAPKQLEMATFAGQPSVVRRQKRPQPNGEANVTAVGEHMGGINAFHHHGSGRQGGAFQGGGSGNGGGSARFGSVRMQPGSQMAAAIGRHGRVRNSRSPPSAQGGDSPSMSENYNEI